MMLRNGRRFNRAIIMNNYRNFAALSESNVSLASVNPSDVHDSTPKAVGALMAAMSTAKEPVSNGSAICDEIDEYFRKKFRQVSFEDGKQIMTGLGFNMGNENGDHLPKKIEGLDDKFWVWETLEEATRPQVDELSKEEILYFYSAWALQTKGSDDLMDLLLERFMYFYAEAPPFMGSS